MKSNDQFDRCKSIFISYLFIIPILISLMIAGIGVSFSFGSQLSETKARIIKIEETPVLLSEIRDSLITLIQLQRKK